MQTDSYDNPLSTRSEVAQGHYNEGLDRILVAGAHPSAAFRAAVEADDGFALGHAGLARACQFEGDGPGAQAAIARARQLTGGLSTREASHINAIGLLIDGAPGAAYPAIRAHLACHPRDALVAQTCSSVFGLIGFSGRPGREAEILAFVAGLLPHYGADWWMESQYAFALCENGDLERADAYVDRSLALRPRNANGAHIRSHVYYESGETDLGRSYLADWLKGYDRAGAIHGHLSWHAALWSLEQGDHATMWARIDGDVAPGVNEGLPINVLTDTASILYRADLAGLTVDAARWADLSRYAAQVFPKPSLGFIDFHAAMAHAMAGDGAALARITEAPNALNGDLVVPVAEAFAAYARQDWEGGVALLTQALSDSARLGGSRAQRDVLELALLNGLLRLGRDTEAQRLLVLRRPVLTGSALVHGMTAH
ncbi:tetratricopeptide repeat protein [Jannaschia sp. M317]|uniref:tetratricopeptide repeat protein n=1 Tax=Jannaschia sp. M317 TaxID=2867011 RepID=UPI0021A4495B|nr:tetratricopeptide repeat protein [Jannaschia sp. M317]UWQ18973.1 tetratricopeptide repeat protein [Jannaschia sp. M317]